MDSGHLYTSNTGRGLTMIQIVHQTKELYLQLKSILIKENDREAQNIIDQIEAGLRIIDEFEDSNINEDDLISLYKDLERVYININQPHVGLSDYFIWKDDYEERIKANKDLDYIKDSLHKLFATY
jgi:hypothetical protein